MILSDMQNEYLDKFNNLRRQVELLDSHMTVFQKGKLLVTDKQYQESLARIIAQVEMYEEEFGIKQEDDSINTKLRKVDEMLTDIRTSLEQISFSLSSTDNLFNTEMHKIIEEIENASKENS